MLSEMAIMSLGSHGYQEGTSTFEPLLLQIGYSPVLDRRLDKVIVMTAATVRPFLVAQSPTCGCERHVSHPAIFRARLSPLA